MPVLYPVLKHKDEPLLGQELLIQSRDSSSFPIQLIPAFPGGVFVQDLVLS